jgi:hypothetical protein
MYSKANNASENKIRSVAQAVLQKTKIGKSTFQFIDNRPEIIAHGQLIEMANHRNKNTQTIQSLCNNNTQLQLLNKQNKQLQKKEGYSFTENFKQNQITDQQNNIIQKKEVSVPTQPVIQFTLDELRDTIEEKLFNSNHPNASQIIEDLAQRANVMNVSAYELEVPELTDIAENFGYPSEYAERLASARPFDVTDISDNTVILGENPYTVTSFGENSNLDKHELDFSYEYQVNAISKNLEVKMNRNFRNPCLSNFKAGEIIEEQRNKLNEFLPKKLRRKMPGSSKMKTITIKGIEESRALEWADNTFGEDRHPMTQFSSLTPEQFEGFKNTGNYKTAELGAQKNNMKIKNAAIKFTGQNYFDIRLTLK